MHETTVGGGMLILLGYVRIFLFFFGSLNRADEWLGSLFYLVSRNGGGGISSLKKGLLAVMRKGIESEGA